MRFTPSFITSLRKHFGQDSGISLKKESSLKMKVKDLVKRLSTFNQDDDIVMKNLEACGKERAHLLTEMRVYRYKDKLFLDGYGKLSQ